jgi:hypothetical protein
MEPEMQLRTAPDEMGSHPSLSQWTPALITDALERPVQVIEQLLAACDPKRSEELITLIRGLSRSDPLGCDVARYIVLCHHPLRRLTQTEVSQRNGRASASAVSQRVKSFRKRLERVRPIASDHPLVTYMSQIMGRLTPISALPHWVREILIAEPETADWGGPGDIALTLGAVALQDRGIVVDSRKPNTSSNDHLWITRGGIDLRSALRDLATELVPDAARLITDEELRLALCSAQIGERSLDAVIGELTQDRYVMWLRRPQRYVVFQMDSEAAGLRARRSAPERALDAMRLVDSIEDHELAEAFITQHGLGERSVLNAIREARSALT